VVARIDIVQRAEELLEGRLQAMGYELVACDWRVIHGRATLQVFIDAEDGVGIGDCLKVNEAVGDLLDVEDPITGRYHLEISSPGLDRPLRKEADFTRFTGERVRARTFEPIDGRRNFHGLIAAVDDGLVTIDVDGTAIPVPVAAMERANLVHEFEPSPGSPGVLKGRQNRRGKQGKRDRSPR
jgi:ribosome maturation factor RimP